MINSIINFFKLNTINGYQKRSYFNFNSKDFHDLIINIGSQLEIHLIPLLINSITKYALMHRCLNMLTTDGIEQGSPHLVDLRPVDCFQLLYNIILHQKSYKVSQDIIIDMKKHNVLSSPWNIGRLRSVFRYIGKNVGNPWIYHENNHYIDFWYPMCMTWMENGLHSGSVAIIKEEGFIPINSYTDMSVLYKHAKYDGYKYIVNSKGIYLPPRGSQFIGSIFELGRYIEKSKLSYDDIQHKWLHDFDKSKKEVLMIINEKYPQFYEEYLLLEQKLKLLIETRIQTV